VTFDPLVFQPDARLASAIVWFDALTCNVDRTARNVNMLMWHRRLWLIDHGAALYFHHAWTNHDQHATSPFPLIKDHVLLRFASMLEEVDSEMRDKLSEDTVAEIIESIPQVWLEPDPGFADTAQLRQAYLNYFMVRLRSSTVFVQEAVRARTSHL
jgi:hypothetical protein